MRPHLILLFLVVFFPEMNTVRAQNLVPNPGFEEINDCPNTGIVLLIRAFPDYTYIPGWTAGHMAHHFSSCLYNHPPPLDVQAQIWRGAPDNGFGHKEPHSGEAYAGLVFRLEGAGGHNYLQARLLAPLEAGSWYCVSFFVAPAIRRSEWLSTGYFITKPYASRKIGAYLSATRPDAVDNPPYLYLDVPCQAISSPGQFISDTVAWTQITGVFQATGGEEWITIGNFDSVFHTQPIVDMSNGSAPVTACIYFVDDVHVSKITLGSGPQYNPAAGAQDTLICTGGPFVKALYAPSGADSYLWSTGATTSSITVTAAGAYWYRAVYNDCGVISDTVRIDYLPNVQLQLRSDTALCSGHTLTLAANASFDTYQWSTGATTPQITAVASGIYSLSVSNSCGVQTDSVSLLFYPVPGAPTLQDTIICRFADPALLPGIGPGMQWYTEPQGGMPAPVISLHTADTGLYRFYVSNRSDQGCESARVPFAVRVIDAPVVSLADDTLFCPGDLPVIELENGEQTYVQYRWNTGRAGSVLEADRSGVYVLEAFNVCGVATDSIRVVLDDCLDCVWLPNAFSPNGDGRNDVFLPVIKCPVTQFRMMIYNRWGRKVFESFQPQTAWEGRDLDAGAYFYRLSYRNSSNGQTVTRYGDISLVR